MTGYSARLDLEAALSTPRRCPGCGAASLVAVPQGEQTNFYCNSCGKSWHIELGRAASIEREGTDAPT
jgi:transposase-like protein